MSAGSQGPKDQGTPVESDSAQPAAPAGAASSAPAGGVSAESAPPSPPKRRKKKTRSRAQTARARAVAEPEVLPALDGRPEGASSAVSTAFTVSKSQFRAVNRSETKPVVVDVTQPSLPAMPTPSTRSSVPALRSRSGVSAQAGALESFLKQMGRYPLLSREEENKLTEAYYERQDPSAARKLVVHNMRLVVKMAYKYRRAWASVLDLIQEGNVGLVEAVQRFDPYKGAKFSTYATFWIRAYMLRYLLENSRTVRISRTRVGRKLFFQLSKERAKLRAMGIEPGSKLLAERLGVDENELAEVVKHMDQPEVRLDAPLGSDEGSTGTILDTFTSEDQSPEAEAFRSQFAADVSKALDAFAETLKDDRERMAWKKHLMAEDPVSLSELGKEFGVTKQRMGQIVSGMRKRLKKHLVEHLGPDVELGFQLGE